VSTAPATLDPTPAPTKPSHRPPRRTALPAPRLRGAIYALGFLGLVLAIGTAGFHGIANLGRVDPLYFESMLASGQGPRLPLTADSAKLYAPLMAFVSVGSVLTTVIFTLRPVLAHLGHEAAQRLEQDAGQLESELLPPRS